MTRHTASLSRGVAVGEAAAVNGVEASRWVGRESAGARLRVVDRAASCLPRTRSPGTRSVVAAAQMVLEKDVQDDEEVAAAHLLQLQLRRAGLRFVHEIGVIA